MSTVELAEDTLLGRQVALKRMHTPDDIAAHSRLRREALIGASLTHPNLVSIFDILTTEAGEDVIVMEYVEGETLAQQLARGKPDLATTLRILGGVSSALDAIHAERIVHRDVKPGNILLGKDGTVKLADLGIAAVPDRTKITSDGTVLGTFSYMAPEQLEGTTASPAVDVYALAAVAYEMLSGRRARDEPNPVALAHAISTQPPPDLRNAWPQAPAEAAELLTRAMARRPADRPRSAGELTARLRAALEPQATARIAPAPIAPARAEPASPPATRQPAQPTQPPATQRPRTQRPPARPAAAPRRVSLPPPDRPRRSRGAALALAGLAAAALAAVIIIATSGGGKPAARSSASKPPLRTHTHASGTATPPSNASTSSGSSAGSDAAATPSSSAVAGSPGSPVSAVENFYHLAAAHQYASAWALADPSFRNQLGGYSSFQGGQAGDKSITFTTANVTNQAGNTATVYVRTISVRDNGTQHCFGPVSLVRGSSGWLLDRISINCTP